MGIQVKLDIIPEAIDPAAWASVYDETVRLLAGYPQGIIGLRECKIGSGRRLIYSRDFEHAVRDPERRHWIISGDADSLQTGETFKLHRNLDHYRQRLFTAPPPPEAPVDLLGPNADGRTVFGDKTQGYPYHIPILATAMIIEAAFAPAALAGGDIDAGQSAEAQVLIDKVLGKRVPLPVRVDGGRLIDRLAPGRTDQEVMEAFESAFCGDRDACSAALLDAFGQDMFTRWFTARLVVPDSNGPTLGTIWRFTTWFNLGLPVDRLVHAACVDPAGPRFDPAAAAGSIAATWVNLPFDETGAAREGSGADVGIPGTVTKQFGNAFLDMQGMVGRRIRVHVAASDILAAFAAPFPDRIAEITTALENRSRTARAGLSGLMESLAAFDASTAAQERPIEDIIHLDSLTSLTEAEQEGFARLGVGLADHYPVIQEFIAELHRAGGHVACRAAASQLAIDRGVVLTEAAWARLDDPANVRQLRLAIMLLTNAEMANIFRVFRRAVLENPVLCAYVAAMLPE